MNKKVKTAKLHSPVFVPGAGNLSDRLDTASQQGLLMVLTSDGIVADYKGFSFVVPSANIVNTVMVEAGLAAKLLEPAVKLVSPKSGA